MLRPALRPAGLALALLPGCSNRALPLGNGSLEVSDDGTFTIVGERRGARLRDVRVAAGTGSAEIAMSFGAFEVSAQERDLRHAGGFERHYGQRYPPYVFPVRDEAGDALGDLVFDGDGDLVVMSFSANDPETNRVGFSAACDADDHFLGLGSHVDVDHVGEAFPLWTSEPGIGKTDRDDVLPGDFPLGGTRHATSFPIPFLLRPHQPTGLLMDTHARVDVDLCASDPDRFELVSWDEGTVTFAWFAGATPVDPIRTFLSLTGPPPEVQPWVFGAWGDAIRGPDRVRAVADTLRAEGAPADVIWSEDWKGATQTVSGYRLGEEWFVDRGIYPDVETLAGELDDAGFQWFAYFAPFLGTGDVSLADAEDAGAVVETEGGETYLFPGVSFQDVALLDVTGPEGRDWAIGRMRDALELGFDGWMADYGEWLPADARVADGRTGLAAHNGYPELWQDLNREAIEGSDATFFVRSGWTRTASLAPVFWTGDQRTSFDADDGFPTVIPLALGAALAGVSAIGHDVAGYQSVGNPPSTKELWFRWCELGAFSPIFRLHHGSFDTDNWQFDSDPETLAHYVRYAREHVRLYPYLHGLHAKSVRDGTPMVLPVGFLHDAPWDRQDAWMLGRMLVAPVLEEGATSRVVALPEDVAWYDWWTGERAESGTFAAPLSEIPVFVAAGTTIPTFVDPPDTLRDAASSGISTLDDADRARIVHLYGGGARFVEHDGTEYDPDGAPSGPAEATVTLRDGRIEVGGLSVRIRGPRERTYTVRVH